MLSPWQLGYNLPVIWKIGEIISEHTGFRADKKGIHTIARSKHSPDGERACYSGSTYIQAANDERTAGMGKHKKNARAKSSLTVSDPHFTDYDVQKERNIQQTQADKPSHS